MAVGRIFFQGGAVLAKFYFNHSNLTKQPLAKNRKTSICKKQGGQGSPSDARAWKHCYPHYDHCHATQEALLCNTTQVVEQHNKYCKQQLTNEVIVNQF